MSKLRNIVITDNSGGEVTLTVNNNVPVETLENGHICVDNSTQTPLGIGGVFLGDWQDTINYNVIIIGVKTDQGSATDGLDVQWSSDGVTIDDHDYFSLLANTGKVFTFSPARRYLKIVYTNGGIAQAVFDIQAMFKKGGFKASSHRIADSIVSDDDAELVKAVLTGKTPNGDFLNANVTDDGYLAISDNSNGLSIASGKVTGSTFIHKFGEAPDFDSGDGEVDIWDGANDALFSGAPPMQYTFPLAADVGTISSSSAADTMDIDIKGLDINRDEVVQTVTLNGQNDVLLATNLFRVSRKENEGAVDVTGVVYLRTNGTAQTLGVPNTASSAKAIINNGNNQTLMCIYTIPNGKTGYMRSFYADIVGGNKISNYKVRLKSREIGGVFKVKHVKGLSETGSSSIHHKYEDPEVFTSGTDIILSVRTTDSPITGANISGGFDIVLEDN